MRCRIDKESVEKGVPVITIPKKDYKKGEGKRSVRADPPWMGRQGDTNAGSVRVWTSRLACWGGGCTEMTAAGQRVSTLTLSNHLNKKAKYKN